jgi:hypothetical protein
LLIAGKWKGFQAADGETWIKSKSGFRGGSRLIQLTGKRMRSGEHEMSPGIICIRLQRST